MSEWESGLGWVGVGWGGWEGGAGALGPFGGTPSQPRLRVPVGGTVVRRTGEGGGGQPASIGQTPRPFECRDRGGRSRQAAGPPPSLQIHRRRHPQSQSNSQRNRHRHRGLSSLLRRGERNRRVRSSLRRRHHRERDSRGCSSQASLSSRIRLLVLVVPLLLRGLR